MPTCIQRSCLRLTGRPCSRQGLQKDRFYPESTFARVAGPAVRAGYEVHYHLWLVRQVPPALVWKNTWIASVGSYDYMDMGAEELQRQREGLAGASSDRARSPSSGRRRL